jgi:hypothetical protein
MAPGCCLTLLRRARPGGAPAAAGARRAAEEGDDRLAREAAEPIAVAPAGRAAAVSGGASGSGGAGGASGAAAQDASCAAAARQAVTAPVAAAPGAEFVELSLDSPTRQLLAAHESASGFAGASLKDSPRAEPHEAEPHEAAPAVPAATQLPAPAPIEPARSTLLIWGQQQQQQQQQEQQQQQQQQQQKEQAPAGERNCATTNSLAHTAERAWQEETSAGQAREVVPGAAVCESSAAVPAKLAEARHEQDEEKEEEQEQKEEAGESKVHPIPYAASSVATVAAERAETWSTALDGSGDEWQEIKDARTGRFYYFNGKQSVWTKPKGFDRARVAKARLEGANGPVTWTEATDEHGRVYWYNKATMESRWDRPASLALPEVAAKLQRRKSSLKEQSAKKVDLWSNADVEWLQGLHLPAPSSKSEPSPRADPHAQLPHAQPRSPGRARAASEATRAIAHNAVDATRAIAHKAVDASKHVQSRTKDLVRVGAHACAAGRPAATSE